MTLLADLQIRDTDNWGELLRRSLLENVRNQVEVRHHHGRQLLVRQRVALSNHMRGVLSEYGIVVSPGVKVLSRHLPEILEDAENTLPMLARHLLAELKAEYDQLIERVDRFEKQLKAWHTNSEVSQRLASIPGIGVLTATALATSVGEGHDFAGDVVRGS